MADHEENLMACEEKQEEKVASILQGLQRDINCLSDGNKMTRRRSLEKIQKEIFQNSLLSATELDLVFRQLIKPLLTLYSFPVDKCRELSIKIVTEFIEKIPEPWNDLPYIIPVLADRLGGQEIVEHTEEIRLLALESLKSIILISKEHIEPYTKDIIQILSVTIMDSFPDVKKASCQCVEELAAVSAEKFYFNGECLIRPLLVSISHQHHKVRTIVLKTIGTVVKGTSGKEVDNVVSHIAQRTFDHSPIVRLMVTNVVGDWLLNLRDRYSFFHKLLPLLMTGLSDEMVDIRQKSKELFEQVGRQYELENEEELKDKLDFQVVKHFESVLVSARSPLGCRILVQRNFSKILPAVLRDITDWVVETRIKASQLLYHLVFSTEDYVTMHLEALLEGLYKAVRDEENLVSKEARKTAELVGLYVAPTTYCKLVLPHLQAVSISSSTSCSSAVSVLSALIRGGVPELLNKEFKDICSAVSSPSVSVTVTRELQLELVALIDAILLKDNLLLEECCFMIFDILLNILSMAVDQHIMNQVIEYVDKLAEVGKFSSRDEVVMEYGNDVLEHLRESANSWTSSSPERLKFEALLTLAPRALPKILEKSIDIFLINLQPTRDPELRLKLFSLLSRVVSGLRDLDDVKKSFQPFSVRLLKEAILPNCVWQAGRVSAAVRSASMSCFWALLQGQITTAEHINELFSEILTQLISCLDDDNTTTRTVTCKTLLKMFSECKASFDADRLNLLYPELLKRMDDSSDEIRVITTKAFSVYFKCFVHYDIELYKLHLEAMFKGLLIHLDDPDKNIQDSVLVALKDAGHIHPRLLRSKLNEVRHKHRLSLYCNELEKYIDTVLVSQLNIQDDVVT